MNGHRLIPMINGVTPSWATMQVLIEGVPVTGITAINYDDKQNIENVYGAGQHPVCRGYGNIEPTADITLYRDEIESIRKSSPTGRLQDIAPFDIVVAFLPIGGAKIANHIIKNCQFLDDGVEAKQGDTKNEKQLNLLPSHIIRK
ncbi:MAG: hypothetical protein FWC34_11100 [Bacteroidetes bacterium]|nr:hypothetical protein [Bacteroidota bacterium]MCL2302911.1 hypothetical protein [Lentimicrobiaceae bacterium]